MHPTLRHQARALDFMEGPEILVDRLHLVLALLLRGVILIVAPLFLLAFLLFLLIGGGGVAGDRGSRGSIIVIVIASAWLGLLGSLARGDLLGSELLEGVGRHLPCLG